jgi:AAA domain
METNRPTTLYLICGKIAAGKSTLARRLATRPATLLISMDDWMSNLFPTENRTIEDFTLLSARLRTAMGPHVVCSISRQHCALARLDAIADSRGQRRARTSCPRCSDVICKERLRQRNESGEHRYRVDEATYDQFMSYFVLPMPDEGFNIVVHNI